MAQPTAYEYLKKLMEERGSDFVDGVIMEVHGGMVDVRVAGSQRVLSALRVAQHVLEGNLTPGNRCSLGLYQSEPYVVAVFDPVDDAGIYTPYGAVLLHIPTINVVARQAGYQITWSVPQRWLYTFELYGNDDDTGNNPHLLYSGPNLSFTSSYSNGYAFFAVRVVTKDGTRGTLSEWITDTTPPVDVANITHQYHTDGHWLQWTHSALYDVAYFEVYRNTVASFTGSEVLAYQGRTISCTIPYSTDGDFFLIRSVGWNDVNRSAGIWTAEFDPTPAIPTGLAVVAVEGGFEVSWNATVKTLRYQLQWAQDGSGTLAQIVFVGDNLHAFIPADGAGGYKYFAVEAIGYDESESGYTAWINDSTAPPVPTGFGGSNGISQIFLTVDLSIDTSHKATGFRYWEVQRADDDTGTNTVEMGVITPSSLPATYPQDPGPSKSTKYYRMRSVDWAGNPSTYTVWLPLISVSQDYGPIEDKFDGYGGSTLSPLDSLWWLGLATFESGESWTGGNADTTYFREGVQGRHVQAPVGSSAGITLDKTMDLSVEGRFADGDYVTLAVYIPDTTDFYALVISFIETTTPTVKSFDYTVIEGTVFPGWNYIRAKKSDFVNVGSASWANITKLNLTVHADPFGSLPVDVTFDDLRIIKADPGDPTTFNDTGSAWDFVGTYKAWHIYEGNRSGEPSKSFGLGVIERVNTTPATWFLAYHTRSNVASGVGVAGVYLKEEGEVAFAFSIQDPALATRTLYAVEADSSLDKVRLVRWVSGTRTLIKEVSFTFAPGEIVWLAADWEDYDSESRIKVYASKTEGNVIRAENLLISETDTNVSRGGYVGLMSKEALARFVYVRAGSPAHAKSAEYAFDAETARAIQRRSVADTAPGNNQALVWNGSEWIPGDVAQLQGRSLAATAPTDGQMIVWNNAASRWEPAGGVDPAGHTHSKMVASDGVPNPAMSADATGRVGFPVGTKINEFSIDGALVGNSDDAVPTEKAVKSYVDQSHDMVLIATQRLVANGVITFSGIPATYEHLMLIGHVRGTHGASTDNLAIRFNNNASAIYDDAFLAGDSTGAVSSGGNLGANKARCTHINTAFSPAGNFTTINITISNYASTVQNKSFSASPGGASIGTLTLTVAVWGLWNSTAAINRIDLLGNLTTNLAAGSSVSLYGIKG